MGCNEMASPFFPPNFLLQMQSPHEEDGHPPPPSLAALLPAAACSNPPEFHGVAAALLGNRSAMSFSGVAEPGGAAAGGGGEDELSDDCSHAGEKKRRLNAEQVRTLERNFELGNKLEPERKMQLARALGLQPRQVAIWFQNRRARWKTKQLEKDYDVLKRQFEATKAENDALLLQNKKLLAEVMALKGREAAAAAEPINLNKDTEGSCSNRSDNSSDVNLDVSRTSAIDSPLNAHHHGGRPAAAAFFQPIRPAPAGVAHLLLQAPPSTRPAELLPCPKAEQGGVGQDHESLCNMFCGLDDQAGFWAWSEHHSFQ